MFVTGPDVVKTVTNEEVTAEELGGAKVHTTKSSVADGAYDNDIEALTELGDLLTSCHNPTGREYLFTSHEPADKPDLSLDTLIPSNPNMPYDIKEIIHKVSDEGIF